MFLKHLYLKRIFASPGCRRLASLALGLCSLALFSLGLLHGNESDGVQKFAFLCGKSPDTIEYSKKVLSHGILQNIIMIRPLMNCLEGNDPRVIDHIRNIMQPPSHLPYHFEEPRDTINQLRGEFGQPLLIDKGIFKGQLKNGFFIEAGAFQFEYSSNTLYFEKLHNWTGLLVEANPTMFTMGMTKHRKSWAANTCLALETSPHFSFFREYKEFLLSSGLTDDNTLPGTYQVQCFPLYSLLLAVGNRTVNYLSLDIEGAELEVLKTIPWNAVDIEVISLETVHAGYKDDQRDLREFMLSKGYTWVFTAEIDDIFVRDDLVKDKYDPDFATMQRLIQDVQMKKV